tara:strand:- start:650 stop:1483 length:834 start_codon:yes stop_codon:yes gene_type:complete
MKIEDITVIVTTFKSDKKIDLCLQSIDKKAKVIIIENSGNKDFKDLIEKKYSNIECILAKENLGYAKANNLGLKKVNTRYALVLNPDTVLKKDTLENFLKSASENADFSLIGPINIQDEEKKIKKELTEVKNLKGFAIFFNMKNFKNHKFFDENYFLYFEEIDLCREITNKKGKIYLDPKIKVFHEGGKSVDQLYNFEIEKNRNWHWMWSTFYYHKKYNNFMYALFAVIPKLLSSIFRIFFYTLLFKSKKRDIYFCRLSGLINSILGKKSWYRPSLD